MSTFALGDGRVGARFDDQLAAMVAARDEGLIAGAGLGNVSLEQLWHALAGTDIVCVQNLFHLAGGSGAPARSLTCGNLAAEGVTLDGEALRDLDGVGA
jgi:aryl-alcohol dehydrogenase-like predicted oxidoreductase